MNAHGIGEALSALRAQAGRAWLTMLGVAIGAGAIVLLVSLLGSGKVALHAAAQDASESDVVVLRRDTPPEHQRRRAGRGLDREDARVLSASPALRGASVLGESSRPTVARHDGKEKRVTVVGTEPEALAVYRLKVQRGRFLDDEDVASMRRVCVVGAEVFRELSGGSKAGDGMVVEMDGQAWAVIGVLADKPMLGATDGTHIWNRKVIIPSSAYDVAYDPVRLRERVAIRPVETSVSVDALRALAKRFVLHRHDGIEDVDAGDDDGRRQETLIVAVIQLLLLATGFVALFVGGINVMNVMLVCVAERTREIGIRRALGATRRAIARQFLMEAAALTTAGGIAGVLGGVAFAWLAAQGLQVVVPGWSLQLPLWSIGLALVASTATGVVFGTSPAWRAAGLSPVEALRAD